MISNVTQTANGGNATQIVSAGVERLWFWEHPEDVGEVYIIKAPSWETAKEFLLEFLDKMGDYDEPDSVLEHVDGMFELGFDVGPVAKVELY